MSVEYREKSIEGLGLVEAFKASLLRIVPGSRSASRSTRPSHFRDGAPPKEP